MGFVNAMGFALRGGSALARFLFVIYLAAKTTPLLLGQVAILMTITAVFIQLAGLEINQVIGRQLHVLTVDGRIQVLRWQAFAVLAAYLVLVPIILFIYSDLLIVNWISACGILVLEHFITEVYRFNILMLRPAYASGLLFIKNAGWVVCFVVLVESGIAVPTLKLVLYCWLTVLVLTVAPLVLTRNTLSTLAQFLKPSTWIKPTLSLAWQARTFIVSAIAMAGVGAMDKLLIAERFSQTELGVYFFFATCASVMTLIVSFSIGATVGPQCIKIYAAEGRLAYEPEYRRLKKYYLLTAATTALAITLPADYLLIMFGKADYHRYIDILYFLVPSTAFVVLCEPYKMNAYLERRERSLVLGNLFHVLCLFVCISLFAIKGDIVWVSAGVLLSSFVAYLFFAFQIPDRLFCMLQKNI
jgi:O-antigen/teichoic acid export membrane protein